MRKNPLIRLGFIGCGKISQKHFDALEEHKQRSSPIQVVAVCDIDSDRVKNSADRMGAKAYLSIDRMLKEEDLDLVTIATPNGLHPEHIKKVASYKIDVITDKPIATNLSAGKDTLDYCNEHGVNLSVVHQIRFNDPIQLLKKAIDQGRFGQIYMITSNIFWTRPQEYYDSVAWHGTKQMDGGAFLTQASHHIDLAQWFIQSRPKMVFAKLVTLARKIETEDTGSVICQWCNGAIGNFNVTMLTYPKNYEGSITILGEKGTVRISGAGMNCIEHWQFSDTQPEDKGILEHTYPVCSIFSSGHARFYENIINSTNTGVEPLITGEEGIKSLELLQAIYDSNTSATPVFFSH
jgi:UDP-N-acetyl-2-amino-2-deoxyglucuronate dehydrogenase